VNLSGVVFLWRSSADNAWGNWRYLTHTHGESYCARPGEGGKSTHKERYAEMLRRAEAQHAAWHCALRAATTHVRTHEVRYKELVRRPEAELRALLKWGGWRASAGGAGNLEHEVFAQLSGDPVAAAVAQHPPRNFSQRDAMLRRWQAAQAPQRAHGLDGSASAQDAATRCAALAQEQLEPIAPAGCACRCAHMQCRLCATPTPDQCFGRAGARQRRGRSASMTHCEKGGDCVVQSVIRFVQSPPRSDDEMCY
jgi:hypothetical protein